jgi:hypothetical protein
MKNKNINICGGGHFVFSFRKIKIKIIFFLGLEFVRLV